MLKTLPQLIMNEMTFTIRYREEKADDWFAELLDQRGIIIDSGHFPNLDDAHNRFTEIAKKIAYGQ